MDLEGFEGTTSWVKPGEDREKQYTVSIEVRDGQCRYLGEIGDWNDLDITWSSEADSADSSTFIVGGTSPWSRFLMRANTNVSLIHFVVYRQGKRVAIWTGRINKSSRTTEGGQSTIKVDCDHDKLWLQYILAWPSPFAPLAAQFPKKDIAFGPAIHVMKNYVIKAGVRLQGNLGSITGNYARADYQARPNEWPRLQDWMYPFIVPPTPRADDTAPTIALVAEMTPISELVAETCKDNNILPDVHCFIPGRDPMPPKLSLNRPGIVIDFVDKDRTRTQSNYRGIWNEIVGEIRSFIRGLFGRYDIPPTVQPLADANFFKAYFGDPQYHNVTWPIFRDSDEHWHRVEVSAFSPTTTTSITGGKSNEFLNMGIGMIVRTIIQQALRLLGIGLSALTGWITGKLEDIFFAYQRAADPEQRKFLGDYALFEDYGGKGYTAYSRDATQALRLQRFSAMGYKTAQFIGDSAAFAPFRPFEDFGLLDPVAWEDSEEDKIIPERVKQITLTANRDNGCVFEVRLGETDRPEEPWAIQQRRNDQFKRALVAAFNAE